MAKATFGTLTIAGTDRTEWVKVNTCEMSAKLNSPSTLTMRLEDKGRGYVPTLLDEVIVETTDVPDRLFAGIIKKIGQKQHAKTGILYYTIQAKDYMSRLDHRFVTAEFENVTLQYIVSYINTYHLNGEGFAIDGVEVGPTLTEKLTFNHESVSSAFRRLSKITGYQGWIDYYKVIHFSQFDANPAPFDITPTGGDWANLEVTKDDQNYMNRVFVRTESVVGGSFTETITGDGFRRNYNTSYVMEGAPTIVVNGVTQTVMEVQNFTAFGDAQWYYADYSNSFWHDNLETVLEPTDVAIITYTAQFDNVAVSQDTDEQNDNGIYEAIREERNIKQFAALQAIGSGLLRAYGTLPTKLRFTTYQDGLEVGQQISVNVPAFELIGDFLIESITRRWFEGNPDWFMYTVQATDQEPFEGTPRVLERLAEMARIGPAVDSGGSVIITY